MTSTRRRWLWGLLWIAYAVSIFVVSGMRVGEGPSFLPFAGRDKILHFLEFALFFLLARKTLGRSGVAWVVSVVYAGSDELHQAFVPTRDASLADIAFDVLGASAAALLWRLASRRALWWNGRRRILFFPFRSRKGGE